ncbi:MAG: hypothetical protein LYZ66_04260 [Nitrososphaerales archaeon]|nr:hypothetical protein [Nitrososphaerales archaeon]
MEHWIEINLDADLGVQNDILLDCLRPYILRLKKKGTLLSWHYFREPQVRFRVRLASALAERSEKKAVRAIADALMEQGLVSEWWFGAHGEKGKRYEGEAERYGRNGWEVAQDYFQNGAEIALWMLDLKRRGKLESPLWAKGLGNPWEGGDENPWREREADPLLYNWSRYVHLFTNQMGFDIDKEAELCRKQSERYAAISRDFGMKW